MWWPVVFWILLVPLLIILAIVYATTKNLYRLSHLLALFTYIILIVYVVDTFSLGRDWILALLLLSTILIIWAGYHVSRPKKGKKRKKGHPIIVYVLFALLLIVLLLGIINNHFVAVRTTYTNEATIPADYFETNDSYVALTITYESEGFLPAGIPYKDSRLCGIKNGVVSEVYSPWLETSRQRDDYQEIMPGATREVTYTLTYNGPRVVEKEGATPFTIGHDALILVLEEDSQRLLCNSYEQHEHYIITVE